MDLIGDYSSILTKIILMNTDNGKFNICPLQIPEEGSSRKFKIEEILSTEDCF